MPRLLKYLLIIGVSLLIDRYAPEFATPAILVLFGFSIDRNTNKVNDLKERLDNLHGKEEEEQAKQPELS